MDNDWRAIITSYPPEKRAWDRTYPWIAYAARPVSFPLSWAFRKAGVTANMVTGLTALLGLAALPGLASPVPGFRLLGALCILAYNVFDCVDGNLARAWPAPGAPVGKFWDQLVGNFYWLSYAALGIGIGTRESILLGTAISLEKYLVETVRHIFWTVLGPDWQKEKSQPSAGYVPQAGRWYYKIYYTLVDLQGHAPLLPLAVLFRFEGAFLAASAFIAALELAVNLWLYLSRSFRLRRHAG